MINVCRDENTGKFHVSSFKFQVSGLRQLILQLET